ncbi:WD40 repeat domain-containing protein [Planctomycetota bacterium]
MSTGARLCILLAIVLSAVLHGGELRRKVEENLVVHPDFRFPRDCPLTTNTDRTKLAYFADSKNDRQVVVNGKPGKEYDRVSSLTFSPDGRRLAYRARSHNAEAVVVDGKEGQWYERINHITFSPDGRRLAYVVKTRNKEKAVIDGEEGKEFEQVFWPCFSPDSRRFAYVGETRGKWTIVIDGRPSPQYYLTSYPVFSPDSKRIAYAAFKTLPGIPDPLTRAKRFDGVKDSEAVMVVDRRESKPYHSISLPVFSPDSERIAYYVDDNRKWRVIVDGEGHPGFDRISRLRFSPNSRHIAYEARKDNREFVVLDGKPGPEFSRIRWLTFLNGREAPVYGVLKNQKKYVVEKRSKSEQYQSVYAPVLSPDGRQLAYRVSSERRKEFIIFDGRPGKAYQGIMPGSLAFAPGTNALVFVALTGLEKNKTRRSFVVHDGAQHPEFDGVKLPIHFSFDGRNIAYTVYEMEDKRPNTYRERVVVNGVEHRPYKKIIGPPLFSPNGELLVYIARNDEGETIVINGKEGRWYEQIDLGIRGAASIKVGCRLQPGKTKAKELIVAGSETWRQREYRIDVISRQGWGMGYGVDAGTRIFLAHVGGNRLAEYIRINNFLFSPDDYLGNVRSSGDFYTVMPNVGNWHRFFWLPARRIVFDSSDKMHYFALKNKLVYSVVEVVSDHEGTLPVSPEPKPGKAGSGRPLRRD